MYTKYNHGCDIPYTIVCLVLDIFAASLDLFQAFSPLNPSWGTGRKSCSTWCRFPRRWRERLRNRCQSYPIFGFRRAGCEMTVGNSATVFLAWLVTCDNHAAICSLSGAWCSLRAWWGAVSCATDDKDDKGRVSQTWSWTGNFAASEQHHRISCSYHVPSSVTQLKISKSTSWSYWCALFITCVEFHSLLSFNPRPSIPPGHPGLAAHMPPYGAPDPYMGLLISFELCSEDCWLFWWVITFITKIS